MNFEGCPLLLELVGAFMEEGVLENTLQLFNVFKKDQKDLAFTGGIALD